MADGKAASPPATGAVIDRLDFIDFPDFVREYQNRLRPVVLSNLCRQWTAYGKWTSAFFREHFGERQVNVSGEQWPMSRFLDRFEASTLAAPSPYLRECYLESAFPELLPDVLPIPGNERNRLNSRLLPGWRGRRYGTAELLMAGAGARFPVLHFDVHHYHAFITQLTGDKRFIVYPPEQTQWMYARTDRPNLSAIDGFDPVDEARFPLFKNARALQIVVRPGETIFVPSGWWHRTEILSHSIAVTWNSVSQVNWPGFVHDAFTSPEMRVSPFKRRMKIAYFAGVGQLLSTTERFGLIP